MEQAFDIYSFYHVIGGFGLGVLLGAYASKKFALQLAIVLPVLWEVAEANILASWLGLIEQESILNSLMDLALTVVPALLGVLASHYASRGEVEKRQFRRFCRILTVFMAFWCIIGFVALVTAYAPLIGSAWLKRRGWRAFQRSGKSARWEFTSSSFHIQRRE